MSKGIQIINLFPRDDLHGYLFPPQNEVFIYFCHSKISKLSNERPCVGYLTEILCKIFVNHLKLLHFDAHYTAACGQVQIQWNDKWTGFIQIYIKGIKLQQSHIQLRTLDSADEKITSQSVFCLEPIQ